MTEVTPAEMVIRLLERGISLATVSDVSGVSIEDLEQLDVGRKTPTATGEELGEKAAKLALMAIQEGMEMLSHGSPALKVRLITSIAAHPMRRMQTDVSKQVTEMNNMLTRLLSGGEVVDDEDDVDEDLPD